MKIRQIDSNTPQGKAPEPRRVSASPEEAMKLFDPNMASGFNIDAGDQPKATQSRLRNSTSLPNSPNANLSDKDKNSDWVRQDMPSLGIPYGVNSFFVKPLNVIMLSRLHAAQTQGIQGNSSQAFTMMLDALNPTIKDFDIRDLTVPDYYSHLYWLRLNSYPRSPFTIPWISKYGNRNETRVTSSNFEFEELKMTRHEYLKWQEQGITFPTVRDMEVMFDNTLEEDTKWMMRYAQYIFLPGEPTTDWMQRKIKRFEEMGNDAISLIDEFATLCTHGVIEAVKVKDAFFDLDAAIKYIEEEIVSFLATIDAVSDDNSNDAIVGQLAMLQEFLAGRAKELEDLKHVKEHGVRANGERFEVETEVVKLAPADVTLLFP